MKYDIQQQLPKNLSYLFVHENTNTTQLCIHPSMVPFLTSMCASNNEGKKILQPYYAPVNHNSVI